jgi:ribosome recycling factor
MGKTVQYMQDEFATIRAGRANPSVLDKVKVDYYGAPTPINQLASISVSEARILVVAPYDKSVLKQIEKAIQASDVGINPQNDGQVLRLMFPQLTEDRRKEIVKDVKKMGEEAKVHIRSIRRDAIEKIKGMKKNGELTEDDVKIGEDKIQKATDKSIKEIDDQIAVKEKEVMTV